MNIPTSHPIPLVTHDNNEGVLAPLIDANGVMRIDNSSLEHFTTCARSAEYYIVERRQPVAERVALRTGGAVHILMEIFYRDFQGRAPHYGKFLEACREVLQPYFLKYPPPPEDHRTLAYLEEHILSYVGYAEMLDDFDVVRLSDGQPAIEVYFEYDLGEVEFNSEYLGTRYDKIKVLWCGRIDMIIKRLGQYWIMDHKTTSVLGPNFFAEFMNSSPAMGYTWAAQKIIGQPVAGLYLNAIALRKPSRSGNQFEIERRSYLYDVERLEEWQYNTLILVSDFLSHMDRGFFPQEYKWCVSKYGTCKYLDVCSMPPTQRSVVLESNAFENVTWNPKHGTRQ
jgi:PD-(D/E)XK nuclease superfamily